MTFLLVLVAATAVVTAHVTHRVTVSRIDPATYDAQWTPEDRARLDTELASQIVRAGEEKRARVRAEAAARRVTGMLPSLWRPTALPLPDEAGR